jgi:TrmH family RNA methyltransferase
MAMSIKTLRKLSDKKFRAESGLFLVEGDKNIRELLNSDFVIESIYGTVPFLDSIESPIQTYEKHHSQQQKIELIDLNEQEIERTGTLVTNNAGIAVVAQRSPVAESVLRKASQQEIILALDDVRDPGNLGTIIRIADWFGIRYIAASQTTTDLYSPKTIAASMGSFTRVLVSYLELGNFLSHLQKTRTPILGAVLDGKKYS